MNFDDLHAKKTHSHHENELFHEDTNFHDTLKTADFEDFGLSFIDIGSTKKEDDNCMAMEKMPPISSSNPQEDERNYIHTRRRTSNRGRRLKKGQTKRSFATRRERHVIQHNYHDHADDVIDFDEYTSDAMGMDSPMKKKGGVAVPFPLKLHELLEKVEEEGQQHVVSWQPHGRAFVVREPKTFVTDLMPRFFRQTKLTSFQRQLNLYGFSRLTRGPDAGGYYHELFLRGKPYLTRRMVRTKIKGTGYKAASNPACEPNFYKMTPVGPRFNNNCKQNCHEADSECYNLSSPNSGRSYCNTMAVVTPDTNVSQTAPLLQSSEVFPMPENIDTLLSKKPFLRPKNHNNNNQHHHSRAVKMGNEYFHYMDSFKNPIDDNSSPDESLGSRSCTPSPIFFEKISSEETSVKDTGEEDPSQDPLSIFLADMDGDFEDDMVFSSSDINTVQPTPIKTEEAEYKNDASSNFCIFQV